MSAALAAAFKQFADVLNRAAGSIERIVGAFREAEFREYARRSGEVVCERSHEDITACGGCGARV